MAANRTSLFYLALLLLGCGDGSDSPDLPPPPSNDSRALEITLSGVVLETAFQPPVLNYTGIANVLCATTSVTVVPAHPNATITINDRLLDAGSSRGIDLELGANTIWVEVTSEDGGATSVYTFEVERQSAANLSHRAYIKASNTDPGDLFGSSVALHGDTLAVGAPGESSSAMGVGGNQSDNSAPESGAVYVFTRDVTGTWRQHAYIKASNSGAGDYFGATVELAENVLIVGAPYEDSGTVGVNGDQAGNTAEQSGAVYVFTSDAGGVWTQQAYIKASNTDAGDLFGSAIALGDRHLAIGAPGEDSAATGEDGDQLDNSAEHAGAVYVYERDAGGLWPFQAYLKAPNTDAGDLFGTSVGLATSDDGPWIIYELAVGAPGEDSNGRGSYPEPRAQLADNSVTDSGAVYAFDKYFVKDTGETLGWSRGWYIKAPNADVRDGFGSSLVITFLGRTTSCCWLAVSAVGEDSNATGVEPSWVDSGIQADNSATNSGAAYLFQNDHPNKDWLEESYIKASNSEENDAYSSGIAISRGGALVVAAMGEDGGDIGVNGDETDNSGADSGAVYVELDPSGHCWKFHVYDACDQTGYIKAANTDSGDRVTSVAIDSDTIVFGAPYEDSNARGVGGDQNNNTAEQSGAVYVIQ